MTFSNDVKKKIIIITAATFGLGIMMIGGFFIAGKGSLSVILGAIIGCLLASLNFFLLAVTVHKAADSEGKSKFIAQSSYAVRNVVILLVCVLAIAFLKVNPIAVILPLIFPRITILFLQMKASKDNAQSGKEGDTSGD